MSEISTSRLPAASDTSRAQQQQWQEHLPDERRRRRRPSSEESDRLDAPGDQPAHELDDLA